MAATDLPDQRLHHQSPIQGQTGEEIEQPQDQVEAPQFTHHLAQHRREMAGAVDVGQQGKAQRQTHGRSCDGHGQGTPGRAALPLHLGHTAHQEQGDAAHLHALGQGHQGMAQLMQKH